MRAPRPRSLPSALLAAACVAAVVAQAAGPAPVAAGDADRVRLSAGYTLDPSAPAPARSDELRASTQADPGMRALLVYYGAADPARARAAIQSAGGRVVSAIADHTFLTRLPASASLEVGGPIGWVGGFEPAYKLSRALARTTEPLVTVEALVFADADLEATAQRARALGGEVLLTSDNGTNKQLRARLPGAALGALARIEAIAWIEPFVDTLPANDRVQWVVQTGVNGDRKLWDMGIHGEGQFVCITDSGIDMSHEMFNDPATPITTWSDPPGHRRLIAYEMGSLNPNVTFGDHNGADWHGTHVASTVAGSDAGIGTSPYDGVAPGAKIWFEDLSGPTLINSMDPFPDLNDLFQPSWDGNGSGTPHIACNAWGQPTDGAYTLDAREVDQFMWAHQDYLIFFANGDQGPSGRVGSPASAKNCVSVGATGNGTSENLFYAPSSPGPTDDGRRKPTLVAPGDGVMSAGQGPANYSAASGTSMATAAAVGAATLIRQYCTDGWYPTRTHVPANALYPSSALLKAMLIASTDRSLTGHTAPDDQIGNGRVDAANVCFFAGDPRRAQLVDELTGLGRGQALEYTVTVQNGVKPMRVVLCWIDYPGDPSSAVQLVNDLDLTVRRGSEIYQGNVFAGGTSVTGGSADHINVEETVVLPAPGPGVWTVRVEAPSVAFGPQPFAVCVTVDDSPASGVEPPPLAFSLALTGPNPAPGSAGYSFALPATSAVELSLYDLRGRRVRRLVDSELGPGSHPGVWDGRDDAGQPVGAGVYWYRLTAGSQAAVRRLVLLR
jgi:subtilase family protein/flagellar hook capping protein FlgD